MLGRGLGCEVGVCVWVGAFRVAGGWEGWFTQLTSAFGICPPLLKEVQERAHTHLHFLH